MENNYDTAIALSHHLTWDGRMTVQTRERVERAFDHYRYNDRRKCPYANTLTMSGGAADPEMPRTHASVMREHALALGVPDPHIYSDESSLDTIGEAVFTKQMIVMPQNFRRVMVITHAYHAMRAAEIFTRVYGQEFDLLLDMHPNHMSEDLSLHNGPTLEGLVADEHRKMKAFLEMFGDLPPGRDDLFLERMMERHPLYAGRAPRAISRFEEMPEEI